MHIYIIVKTLFLLENRINVLYFRFSLYILFYILITLSCKIGN